MRGRLLRWSDQWIASMNGAGWGTRRLPAVAPSSASSATAYFPMLEVYPQLKEHLQRLHLCALPTPIQPLGHLERTLWGEASSTALYMKNDGLTNTAVYGGNKPRKLELLFAQAFSHGATTVLSAGTVGSHSVLATVLHAQRVGLRSSVHLAPQEPSLRVAQNLLKLARALCAPLPEVAGRLAEQNVDGGSGHMQCHRGMSGVAWGSWKECTLASLRRTRAPFICPTGATSALSTLAYVNAMFELADDVREGRLPSVPDRIYVPAGSGGTYVGLLIGVKAIALFRTHGTQVIGVGSGSCRPARQAKGTFDDVIRLLVDWTDGAFPEVSVSEDELRQVVDHSFSGGQYGRRTPEGDEAEALLRQDGLVLEATYTAKTMARLIRDARRESAQDSGQVWLFWNTNNAPLDQESSGSDHPLRMTEDDRRMLRRFLNPSQMRHYFPDRFVARHT